MTLSQFLDFSDTEVLTIECVGMIFLAFIVYIILSEISAPYGMLYAHRSRNWGPTLPNKLAWVLMELPAPATMLYYWVTAYNPFSPVAYVFAILFLIHYFQRTFIFPFLMRGKSRMPLVIMLMGALFNFVNSALLGRWFFQIAPTGYYTNEWYSSPCFIIGLILFVVGMVINLHSDHIIRNLRKPGDTRHYIPMGGMFRYVACANYFGELVEWVGYAVMTLCLPAIVFAIWTFCNLAPRAAAINHRYACEFGFDYMDLNRKRLIPFIY